VIILYCLEPAFCRIVNFYENGGIVMIKRKIAVFVAAVAMVVSLLAGTAFAAKNWVREEIQRLGMSGTPREVEAAIDEGAHVYTILYYAARHNPNPEVVKLLMASGADVNAKYKEDGEPVLSLAAGNKNPEIVQMMVASGADVNARNDSGHTVLMTAAVNSNPDVAKALIAYGADVNASDSNGWTPLMYAMKYNNKPEVTTALIAAGADVNAVAGDGSTPWSLARKQ
jgi:hypothetical protein